MEGAREAKVPKFKRCKISRQQRVVLMQHFGEFNRPKRPPRHSAPTIKSRPLSGLCAKLTPSLPPPRADGDPLPSFDTRQALAQRVAGMISNYLGEKDEHAVISEVVAPPMERFDASTSGARRVATMVAYRAMTNVSTRSNVHDS